MILLNKDEALNIINNNKEKSYTYFLLDCNAKPFYVGVGTGYRVFSHLSSHELKYGTNKAKINKIKKLFKHGEEIKFSFALFHKDRNVCLKLENKAIEYFGRKDIKTGILTNLTNGGEIGPCGVIQSEESNIKRRETCLLQVDIHKEAQIKQWDSYSEERKEKIRDHLRSIKGSEKARKNLSEALKRKWTDPQFKEKRLKQMQAGKQSAAIKNSSNMKNKWQDPEFRKMMLEKRKQAREKKLNEKLLSTENI